jgi:hypothetical protein
MKHALVAALVAACGALVLAQDPPRPAALTDSQMEEFLLHAKILKTHAASKGITGSRRATLSDGTLTHDAHIQAVDEFQSRFVGAQGVELNFHDSWMYNVAAYKIDRMIGLNLIPPTVKRTYDRKDAAFTWWVDDVQMDEEARIKKKIEVPDPELWNRQMFVLRVFDQLIGNTDRNLGNLLITRDWRIRAIDHTRAFRLARTIQTPANVTRCDRTMLERMKALDSATLKSAIGPFTYTDEIRSLLGRRDEIVKMLEKAGPSALYDR